MRILALNWRCPRHPQAGGGEVNIFEQASHWSAAGHDVTVVCADPGRAYAPDKNEVLNGVKIIRMGGQFSVYAQCALFLLSRGRRYDVILDVSNGIPFFSPLFTRTPSVLFVHHVHDRQWFTEFPWPAAAVGRFLECTVVPALYRRRQVVAVSTTTEADLKRIGFRPEAITIVDSGVSVNAPQHRPAPTGHKVLYLGRLKRYKRVDKTIRAIAKLAATLPDVHLDIVGDGDARAELEALVAELNLQHHVTFHGFVDERSKTEFLASAMVFANASMHEGWGLGVIEANVCGCPAVAYNVPGLRAAIKHNQTGLLAETDAEFVTALERVLSQPELRARLAAAAETWAARFDWGRSARETESLLEKARAHGLGHSVSAEKPHDSLV